MGRKPRYYLPEIPCHIIQRGNDRQETFYANGDYWYYLESLAHTCEECELHAYVSMPNHVHLLITPSIESEISRVVQSPGRRYVQ